MTRKLKAKTEHQDEKKIEQGEKIIMDRKEAPLNDNEYKKSSRRSHRKHRKHSHSILGDHDRRKEKKSKRKAKKWSSESSDASNDEYDSIFEEERRRKKNAYLKSQAAQNKFIGSKMLGTTLSLAMNFLIQTASLAVSDAAIYLASVVESAVVLCFELFQLTAPSFKVNTYPDCNLRSSWSI
ncbi:uncharacterized protein LOC129286404 [Prosopis cineraria]|uniref:uncharacterized protein LOC129286404 n=1 Tax=Prosopis cineraria TaxID=364024 RepID=UPI00240EA9B4|nr:uncharacterized protein LOC129286404 [Prosopis cineraria]